MGDKAGYDYQHQRRDPEPVPVFKESKIKEIGA